MRTIFQAIGALAAILASGPASAALVDRGGGMIYDDVSKITWLADMNYARTSGYSGTGVNPEGTMTWAAARIWANNLVYGGYEDWRLPTLNPSDTTCSDNFDPGRGLPLQYLGHS